MLNRLLAVIVVLLLAASTAVPAFAQSVDMTMGFPFFTFTPDECAAINADPATRAAFEVMMDLEAAGCPAP